MYTAQMREFLDAIEEGRPPRPSGEDGRVVMRIVDAAYAAARPQAEAVLVSRISWSWA